jgi:hypothetical protein
MIEHLGRDFLRAVWRAIGHVLRAALAGVVLGGLAGEIAGYFIDGGWPGRVFIHVAAGTLAVVLGYALAITVALVEGVRGLVATVEQVDDVARAAADAGLNVLDAAVDAVDGPDRHGFRGIRDQAAATGRKS